jgi:hypothetical protein
MRRVDRIDRARQDGDCEPGSDLDDVRHGCYILNKVAPAGVEARRQQLLAVRNIGRSGPDRTLSLTRAHDLEPPDFAFYEVDARHIAAIRHRAFVAEAVEHIEAV